MSNERMPTWRPTADSFRDLALFWTVVGVVASAIVVTRGDASTLAAISAIVVVIAAAVTALFGRRRIAAALTSPSHPQLANWPPTIQQQERLRRAERVVLLKTVLVAVVTGVIGGMLPLVSFALVGAGIGGAIGSVVLWRIVRRYESTHDVTVLTAGRNPSQPKSPLLLGVAARSRA